MLYCTGEKELFLISARRRIEARLRKLLQEDPPAEAVNAALAELERMIDFCFSDEAVDQAVQHGFRYAV
ncbi:hypothetical protein EDD75_0311 [Thermodesulfitimonas autotrophica]|uniref:Uncharacterized protein n=1 Tax=Thermodesulfitimonas autotrophica TaxID=1894989 RepID=A0A3N5BUD6_9THEO|nr:hypothetical protein [Thermodesulfitimonas autotrophica]RPF49495.1 hypothetical protein EDD75_0311 [Thermodesulfitimonas autotrophica]